jgi:uncharacterized protein (TIGR03000 family)
VTPSYAPVTSAVAVAPTATRDSAKKATVVVTLPADAKLFFDGKQTRTKSGQREFVSPDLEPGMDYHYTIKAEIVRDGKTDTKSETVTVRAGRTARVSFEFPTAVAAK